MDGCTNVFNLDNASALKDLQKDYGSNIDGFSSALTKLVNKVEEGKFIPTKEFSDYFKAHYNKEEINFNSDKKYIRKAIKDFITKDNFDINSTSIQRDGANPNAKFYTDAATRNFGKKLAIGIFNDVYTQYQFDKAVRDRAQASIDKAKKAGKAALTLNDRAFYTRIVASAFRNELFDRIAAKEGKKTDELLKDPAFIKSIIKGNKFDFDAIYDKLGGDDATTQDKNLYAIFREMHGAHRKEYFDEMFRDGRLNYLKLKESDDDKEIDAQEDAEENGRISDVDGKAMAEAWSDKDSPSFVSSIDSDLRVWFGSIKRLNSTNTVGDKLDFDTNNNFGIPDRLDASETVNTLIHLLIGVNNTQEAINRINTAASTLAGHASYKVIADKMKENSDLANRVMRNLSKMVGSKSMIVVRDGKVAAQISNSRSNNVDALFSDFVNSARKAVVTNIDVPVFKNRIKVITDNLTNPKTAASEAFLFIMRASSTDQIIDAKEKNSSITSAQQRFDVFLKAFHEYFPTVSNEAIIGYIKHNEPVETNTKAKEAKEITNFRNLASLLTAVAEQGDKSRQARDKNYQEADLAHDKNWQLEKKYGKAAAYRDDYIDEDAIRYQDYLNNNIYTNIADVANAMKDYMVTDIATTSMNALRKQSSDVLDNNRVTEIMRITRSYATLAPYGEIIENIATSPYSNILIEHKDANGNAENFGLFRENPNTGKLEPTEYASDLISTSLFNGINDNDNGNNTIYNKMLTADYIASAFNAFFKPATTRRQQNQAITYASYFMRTPSDAPKNFVITAPKYAYGFGNDALYIDSDKAGTDSKIDANIKDITNNHQYGQSLIEDKALAYNPMASVPENVLNLSSAQVARLLLGKSIDKVKIDNKTLRTNITSKAKKNNGTARFIVSDAEKEGKKTVLVVEAKVKDGKITDITSKGLISEGSLDFPDTKLEGTIQEAAKAKLDEQLRRDMLNKGEITTKINTNHPIFKAYKRAFMGEVMEAANALDKFFETNSDGSVVIYPSGTHKGELVAKGASWIDENGVRQYDYSKGIDLTNPLSHHGYEVYHSDNGVVYDADNRELKGKVFTSNKFAVGTTNFGNELMQKLINPLYRGADNTDKAIPLKINRNIDGRATGYGELTAEQETAINDMISNYIKALSDNAVTRFNDYKQFINNDVVPTKENIIEFITNNNLMEYNFDELYEGNSKFYKSAQDFLKRAKEAQAGGDPYGMADFSVPDALADMTTIRHLDGLTKVDANGKKSKYDVELRNKFRAVTIYNSVRTDEKTEQRLIDAAVKRNPQGEKARARITDIIKKAHDGLKANDAQSFITYEEWIRRIAGRGQLEQYKDLINAINDESKPVNAKAIGQFVQVQKNFYYDQYYDKAMGIMIPRQIKNAEFVLIPRFIKGTELEQVYNLMKNNNIDQLNTRETSKAGKHNVLRLWDDFGNLDSKAIEQFGSNASSLAEEYDYRHLYTQQETVQHTNADNKVAVQIVKKIVDNISDGPLKDVKDDFFRTYSTKIYRSFHKLIDELHIPLDDNGHLKLDDNGDIAGIDADMLLEKLQNEALRNGMDSNLIDYFTKKPDDTAKELGIEGFKGVDTLMPMYLSNMSNKTQSVVNALFNSSITRQKLNGFHAAQVTNIGFKAYKQDIEKSKELKYLRYHENPDGSYAAHMEIAMTYSAFGIDVNNKHYTALREEARKEAEAELANGNVTSSAISAFAKKYSVATSKQTKANVADQASTIEARTKEIFDQKIIKELEEDGLDRVVSYRIPTEGKQSMAIAKIAHFLDDTYGSTIVVPDEWVAQTGSDFDIDSVYGIQHRSYIDRDGRVRKYNWIDEPTEFDYFHYVNRELKRLGQDKYNTNIHDDIEKALKDLDDINDKEYHKLQDAEAEAYKALPDTLKKDIKDVDSSFVEDKTLSRKDNYLNRLNAYKERLSKYLDNEHIKDKEKSEPASKFLDTIFDIIDYLEDNEGRKEKRSEAINKLVEERRQKFEDVAKKNNLKSYLEYINSDAFERNSDNALDNKMVDDMLDILSDPSSTEENLSASTFAQITEANRKIEEFGNTKEASNERKARSPYNFLDQASYMNDVMSGDRLKAFSVTRDTFCSVCNTVRPVLNDKFAINIKYPDGKVKRHRQYGWATDDDGNITNRNVDEYLITPYSSQTSAHAFDAPKEGSIPNVNEYTFAAYKLFPEIGSNYLAAISFIRQPGITKIVNAYNRNTSVFNDINRNPIHDAIRSVSKDLGINYIKVGNDMLEVDRVPINTVVKAIDDKYHNQFRYIFPDTPDKPINIDNINYMKDVPLDVKTQIARCQGKHNNKLTDEEIARREALYDLGTILQFQRLNTIAQKITDLARVCNPDKFGAKQTIYSTNKVFDDIQTIIENEKESGVTLKVKREDGTEVSFLNAIYPNVDLGLDKYITSTPTYKSSYSTLDSFLRYATASSIKAARPLFKTQNKGFRDLCDGLSSVLDARGKSRIDEDTNNDFEKYVLGDIYNNVPGLTLPLTVNVEGDNVIFGIKHDANVSDEVAKTNEINRIYGYGHGPTFEVTSARTDEDGNIIKDKNGKPIEYRKDFTVENMNAPTEQEVSEFEQLTPAQKVQFIKDRSIGDNIFMHLNVNLDTSNRRYRRGQQTIELIQDTADAESLYELFDAAINNKNPLVASAAMDLIKYSFVVEGYKMSRNAINGIIKNTALYGDTFGKDNKSIVRDIDDKVSTVDHVEDDVANHLYEDYVRSHPNMRGIAKTVNYKIKGKGYEFHPFTDKPRFGLIQIKNPIDGSNKNDGTNFLESHNIITFKTATDATGKKFLTPVLNKYIRMRKQGTKDFQLYKTEFDNNGDYIYLIPLNPLEANEHGTFSANPKYHTFASVDYYENLIKGDINKPTIKIEDYMAKEIPSKFKGTVRRFDLNNPGTGEGSKFEKIVNDIANDSNFINNDSATKYIWAPVLHDYFRYASFGQSSHQVINLTDKDGTTIGKDIAISRLLTPRQIGNYRNNYLKHGATVDTKHNKVSQEEADAINAGLKDGASWERMESIYKVEHVSVNPSDGLRMSSVSEDTTPPVEKELQDTDADKVVNKTPSSALLQHRINKANQAAVKAIMLSDDPVATAIKDDMRKHNINQGIESVKANSTLIAYAGYRFATEKRDRILNNPGYSVNNFAQFEGHWVDIKHDKVRELIRTNADVRRDFLTLLAEAKQFCKDFADFDYLDISSIDGQEKFYYDEIKKAVNEIKNNSVLEDARVMFRNDYLDRMSTNPNVQEGLLSVGDGYHGSSFLESQIGDLQNAPSPMVQITTKLIMDDIQSKDKAGRDELAKINKEIAKIINDAKDKGENCSWNDVIDEYGRLKQDYNDELFKDYDALNDAMLYAKIKHGDNSIEYLKARLAKRRWMAKNVQQEVTYDNTTFDGDPFADPDNRSYYDRLNDLEEKIITKAPEIYSEYNKRVATRNGLYSKRVPGIVNDALEKQIDAAEKDVQRLVSDFTVDAYGEVVSKTEYDEEHPYSNDATKRTQQKINSLNSARILKKYLEDRRDLQSDVYEDETRSGWADDLKRNQAIIDKYEDRTDSGELKVNRSSLAMQYPDYARALEWMHNNARKEVASTGDVADWYLNEEWRLDEAAREGKTKEYLVEHYALNTPLVANNGKGLDSTSIDKELKTSKPLAIHHETATNFLSQELEKAFELTRGKKQDRAFYKAILNKHEGIINRYGEVDATLLNDDEIAKIKKQQEINNNIRGNAVGSDRTIINNAGKNPIVYNSDFYKGLSITGGKDNTKHLELVNKFNELVRPYWDRHNNRLCTYLMPVKVLHDMTVLLDKLSGVKSKNGVPKEEVARIMEFRGKNVDVVTNYKEFEYQKNEALKKGTEYYNEWLSANAYFDLNGTGDLKPVERLYSYLKPKEKVMSKFIDFKRTRAFKLLDDMYETVNTDAYDRKFNEMKAKGDDAFNKWYLDNTIYNPYTHSREPLMCWRKSQLKSGVASTWVPTASNTKRVIAKEFRNKNFHAGGEGLMLGKNFNRETAEDKYKSAHALNDSQRALRDYIQSKLDYYTRTRRDKDDKKEDGNTKKEDARMPKEEGRLNKAQRYVLNGQMPMEYSEEALKSMNSKGNRALDAAKEATEGIRSFLGLNGAREINNDQSPIDWHTPLYDMPMTTLLKTKNSVTKKFVKPNRTDFEEGEAGDTKYNEAVQQYRKDTQAARQKNLEENAKVMNKDWEKVFQDFVTKAIHYNAIQDNRALAHYTRDALERANIYDQNSATTRFKRDGKASTPDSPQYVKVNDENLKQQFDVWYRRLFCDQWREPTSAKLNRIASYLQNFTSSTYMMMNVRGGISNITTGLTNIAGEAFAADYFGHRNWINGSAHYYNGLADYLKNMFTNKSDTLEGGLIKWFNIVEFDRLNNLETNNEVKGVIERARDFAYSPQSAGEHFMQNTAMLTMMDSHRLVLDPNASKTGSPKYRIVNEAEYIRDAQNEALRQVLNDEQYAKFIEFQEKVKNDPQIMKRYAWFRGDFVTDFLRNFVSDNAEERTKIQKEFIKAKDKIKQDKIKEFEKAPKLIDQFELGDDREIHFKKDSILNEIDVTRKGETVSDAYKLIGSFTNRVISVNKKIHGVYDRLGGAQIEKHVWGSLVMQYHKHIYPGLMKHWRRRGYYNEERGTIEKGCYTALKDFITLPLDDARIRARINDEDIDSWKGLQNFVRSSFDYLRNLKTVWQLLPDYERNNVRRNLGDIGSIASAFFTIFALRMIQDNKDKDSIAFNLCLYEADRLASESSQFNPIGLVTQGKTLWSQPIAAESIITDLTKTLGELSAMAIEGDDYDGYYHSGIHHGESKIGVYVKRRIPIYRQYYSMSTLPKNNKSYRIGDNTLTFLGINPKGIAEDIRGKNLDD